MTYESFAQIGRGWRPQIWLNWKVAKRNQVSKKEPP